MGSLGLCRCVGLFLGGRRRFGLFRGGVGFLGIGGGVVCLLIVWIRTLF